MYYTPRFRLFATVAAERKRAATPLELNLRERTEPNRTEPGFYLLNSIQNSTQVSRELSSPVRLEMSIE